MTYGIAGCKYSFVSNLNFMKSLDIRYNNHCKTKGVIRLLNKSGIMDSVYIEEPSNERSFYLSAVQMKPAILRREKENHLST